MEVAAPAPAATGAETSPQRLRSLARAAQSDILRRLTPPLRHDMVVHLQSLGMMADALSARMERGPVASEDLQSTVSKLNRISRNAVTRCLEVCSWMQPAEDDTVPLREGVAEIARLLSTSLNFRGFELKVEQADADFGVCRSALRFLLAAAILTLVDTARAPGEVALKSEVSSSHAVLVVEYEPHADGSYTQLHDAGEAPLAWNEVQALALVHDVELQRNGNAIVLRLRRAVATTPLALVAV